MNKSSSKTILEAGKTRLTIELDPKTKERFKAKASAEGRTMKWLIKEWIKDYIK